MILMLSKTGLGIWAHMNLPKKQSDMRGVPDIDRQEEKSKRKKETEQDESNRKKSRSIRQGVFRGRVEETKTSLVRLFIHKRDIKH